MNLWIGTLKVDDSCEKVEDMMLNIYNVIDMLLHGLMRKRMYCCHFFLLISL
jgi:hypothetical protein